MSLSEFSLEGKKALVIGARRNRVKVLLWDWPKQEQMLPLQM